MTTPTRSDARGRWRALQTGTVAGRTAGTFHLFLGSHSLLIGLLPFYLPVWLWRNGLDLAGLSLLIGVSGLAFAAALTPWQRIGTTRPARDIVALTLLLELVLVTLAFAIGAEGVSAAPMLTAIVLGVANGAYNAFFWTTQRVLFAATLAGGDTGRRYGSVQIFVAILLKAGIVAGGVVLQAGGLGWLLLLSLLVALPSAWQLNRSLPQTPLLEPPSSTQLLQPGARTRYVFLIDGVFLMLESHFWTLSLFLVYGEDFARLGLLVVGLGIAFAVLFWLARSLVDRIAANPFYRLSVLLYAASWALRAQAAGASDTDLVLPLLIAVTFCSSIFRLTFNKRFFEHARSQGVRNYLVWKSRQSQTALGLVFLGVALALSLGPEPAGATLDTTYTIATLVAFGYLFYPRPPAEPRGRSVNDRACANGSLGHAEPTRNDDRPTEHAGSVRDPQLP